MRKPRIACVGAKVGTISCTQFFRGFISLQFLFSRKLNLLKKQGQEVADIEILK